MKLVSFILAAVASVVGLSQANAVSSLKFNSQEAKNQREQSRSGEAEFESAVLQKFATKGRVIIVDSMESMNCDGHMSDVGR